MKSTKMNLKKSVEKVLKLGSNKSYTVKYRGHEIYIEESEGVFIVAIDDDVDVLDLDFKSLDSATREAKKVIDNMF